MKRTFPWFFALLLLLPALSDVYSQQLNFRNYSVEDGVAQSQIYGLIQDSRGYLWMGTRGGGLTRFDGLSFKTFTTRDGLPNNYINFLFEDSEKNIWIGTNNGLCCYNGLKFENFSPPEAIGPISFQYILQDGKSIYWLATTSGMYTFNRKTFSDFSKENNFHPKNISCLFKDDAGSIWVGSDDGLSQISYERESYHIKNLARKEGLNNTLVRAITGDATGNLWIGTYGGGVSVFNGQKFERIDKGNELGKKNILYILRDSKKNLWCATSNSGVCKWNPTDSSFTWLTEKEGLSNNNVHSILEDSWGNMWFGTSGGGLSRYSGQQFTHYDKNSGLPGTFVYAVYNGSEGKTWLGVADRGLCLLENGKIFIYDKQNGFKNTKVKSICEGKDYTMWVGTDGQGLWYYQPAANSKYQNNFNEVKELKGKYIRDIKCDSSGTIWVATAGAGIYKLFLPDSSSDKRSVKNFTMKNGLASLRVNCLQVDKLQRVWLGYENDGIACVDRDSVVIQFGQKDSLISNAVRSFAEDKSGFLYIGTAGAGVCQMDLYKGNYKFSRLDSLTSNNVYLLQFDSDENLYVGSESGIDRVSLGKERSMLELKHFGKEEGFLGIETCQNASSCDSAGNVWFGTINGVTRFDPKTKIRNVYPPKLFFTNVELNNEPLVNTSYAAFVGGWGKLSDNLCLMHNENKLSFSFAGINLSNPQKVFYSCRLEGLDKEWSPVSSKSDVTFSNLAPGAYTFMVKAFNEDMIPSEELKFHFTIASPFWLTWWFIAFVLLLGVLLVVVIVRTRVSVVRKKSEAQRKELEVQKTVIELEQKALRLQMNPHFIFNALNSIQSLISQKDEQTARFFLAKFSKLMRQTLENSRSELITLRDEIKALENYLSLEKFSSGDKFDYKIILEEGMDAEELRIPPMLIQPFVENAIIHGIKNLGRRGELLISFSLQGDVLECSVVDNGIGREMANEIKSQQEQYHKSTALIVTQERLDILNKDQSANSLEIIDLKNDHGESAGTRVIIRVFALLDGV